MTLVALDLGHELLRPPAQPDFLPLERNFVYKRDVFLFENSANLKNPLLVVELVSCLPLVLLHREDGRRIQGPVHVDQGAEVAGSF